MGEVRYGGGKGANKKIAKLAAGELVSIPFHGMEMCPHSW